nr:hypothetical protein [Geobacter sp.]
MGEREHLFSILFIAVTSWLFINATIATRDIILSGYDFEAKDNLKARAVHTQLTVLVKIVVVIVIIFAVAQVTKVSEQTMELRALMSAPDSSTAWDLRCKVREKLVAFLQENYPDSLPRVRAELNRQST